MHVKWCSTVQWCTNNINVFLIQNEIEIEDAKLLVKNGCKMVLEGANMPSTAEAIHFMHVSLGRR